MATQIGPYKITREVACDPIAHTLEAVDQDSNKRVTLKHFSSETLNSDALQRLYSEANTLALLNHPHIGRIFGFVRNDTGVYLVMEFLEGETLEAWLKKQISDRPDVALDLFGQIISAIGFAHDRGVIHGCLKPSSILVSDLGVAKVVDFPLALILRNFDGPDSRLVSRRHISPEQIRGEHPDARSDIYSLGMLLYEAIVGKRPFDIYGQSDDEILRAQEVIPAPPSLFLADIPKWLDDFLLCALAPSRSSRFQSIKAMSQAMGAPVARVPARALAREHGAYPKSAPAMFFRSASTRYAWSICLIFLIFAGAGYFGGANFTSILGSGLLADLSLNDKVDAMFARLEQQALHNAPAKINNESVSTLERKEPTKAAIIKTPIIRQSNETAATARPEASERVTRNTRELSAVISSGLERRINLPSTEIPKLQGSSIKELTLPNSTAQGSTPQTQLKVQWDN